MRGLNKSWTYADHPHLNPQAPPSTDIPAGEQTFAPPYHRGRVRTTKTFDIAQLAARRFSAGREELNMKKMICGILGMIMLAAGIYPGGLTEEAAAEVNVEVNIGAPVIMVDEPAEVVFVPAYGIYFVPGLAYDIFFYNGFWWSHRGNRWYNSRFYRSGWRIANDRNVPGPVFKMPRNYRQRFGRSKHIRYQDWKERPGRQKNMKRDIGTNTGRTGNWGKVQQSGNNMERGGDRRPENGGRNIEQNKERGDNRGNGQPDKNADEGGGRQRN